jgi:anti-anti-sigma regulatory factor
MPVNTVRLNIDGARVALALEEALAKLEDAAGEVILDFSSVQRVDPAALGAMDRLAGTANGKAKIVLRGVNAGIYKTLKLMKLAPRFSFLN